MGRRLSEVLRLDAAACSTVSNLLRLPRRSDSSSSPHWLQNIFVVTSYTSSKQYLVLISIRVYFMLCFTGKGMSVLPRVDTMSPYAQPKVLSVPELVQMILSHLPISDLLRVQRVCRLWKDTTENSLALQKKLFFQPISDTSQEPEFNPLLQDVFPQFSHLHCDQWDKYAASPRDFELINWFNDPSRRDRVLRPEASWRRMLPIQPPTKIELVGLEGGCTCFYELDEGVIADHFQHLQEPGVSMGFLWDLVIHILAGRPEGIFYIHWHMFHSSEEERWWGGMGLRNAISVHAEWSLDCYPPASKPLGLTVRYFDPDIITWKNKGHEEADW
jgi:hypothetical protein